MTRLRQTIARRLKDAQNTAAMLTTFNDVDMSAVMKPAQRVQGPVREAPRREARLHGLLREGLHPGAEGGPGRQRRDRRRTTSSTRTTTTSASPSAPRRAWSCRWCARPTACRWPRSSRRSPTSASARATASSPSRTCRAAPSPSPTAASTARCCRRRSSTRRSRASSACTASRSAPWCADGQIVARPMMYLALSYDHRIVDGKDAVTFLVRVKECLEDPQRFLLDL